MKKILLLLLLAGLLKGNIYAQAKQREELLKQITALKMYASYAQKGYSIAKKGLSTIGDFKRGELDLHTDYFHSLKTINLNIKNYTRVPQIITLKLKIAEKFKSTLQQIQEDDLFHGDELAYIKRVMNRLVKNGDSILDELSEVLTAGKLEMKDDQRINKIDVLYENMLDGFVFSEHFSDQTRLMSLSRRTNSKEVKISRELQGIKNNIP